MLFVRALAGQLHLRDGRKMILRTKETNSKAGWQVAMHGIGVANFEGMIDRMAWVEGHKIVD